MPRKPKPKVTPEPEVLHGKLIEAIGFKVKELPFITFFAKNPKELKSSIKAELTRRYPYGYTLEEEDF